MLGNLVRSMQRRSLSLTVDQWAEMFKWGGLAYPVTSMGTGDKDVPPDTYGGFTTGLLYANPAVFTCVSIRQMIFSEARFKWRQLRGGHVGDIFGTPELAILETPEPGKTTTDLLSLSLTFADLGGNWYGRRSGGRIVSLRPDWVEIIFGTRAGASAGAWDLDAEVIGYRYTPGGPNSSNDPVVLDASEVAHFMPSPDPLAPWRGMSWLTPLVREVMGDQAASRHKLKFFEQGATSNLLIKPPEQMGVEEAREWQAMFEASYDRGIDSAYRTLFVGGGADATVIGADFQQMDFRALQGLSETRIAAAAGVGAVVAQFSEGLQGSALNAGNYSSARRRVADVTIRPLWSKYVGALSHIVPPPAGAELWYDDRHIPFLQEDAADDAKIQQLQAASIRQLVDAGFEPAAVVDAITSGDLRRLSHTGLFSVQLQPPGSEGEPMNPQQPARLRIPSDEITLEDEFGSLLGVR